MPHPFSRCAAALALLLSLPLAGQQRIEPVSNLHVEPVNEFADAVAAVVIQDSVLYFAMQRATSDSVIASDGTAPGTRAIGGPGEGGAEILYGFGHAGDYYYVTDHYLSGLSLRRANYAADRDEAVLPLPGNDRPEGYQTVAVGPDRTLFIVQQSDSLRLYLLGESHAARRVAALPRTDGQTTVAITEAYAYAPDSVRLTVYSSFPATRTIYRLALPNGTLRPVSRTGPLNPAQGNFTVAGLLFAGALTPAGQVVHVYAPDGRLQDSLNFGGDGLPKFVDPPVAVGDAIYFAVRREFRAELYRYRPGQAPEPVATDAAGEFLLLASAPGPLGAATPYALVRESSTRTAIYLLESGELGRKVASVPADGAVYPTVAAVTAAGIFFRIPQRGSPETLYFTNGRAGDGGRLSELNGTPPFAYVNPEVIATASYVYFTAARTDEDLELYRTAADGTDLTRLTDLNRPGRSQSIFGLRPFRGGLVFRAAGPQDNTEWWIVPEHGSAARKLAELDDDEAFTDLRLLGGLPDGDLLFHATRFGDGGVYRTDGTAANTRFVTEDFQIRMDDTARTFRDGLLYVGTRDNQRGLIYTDGTRNGTRRLYTGEVLGVAVNGERAFFTTQQTLYVTDGTAAGTQSVASLTTEAELNTIHELTSFRDGVLFEGRSDAPGFGVYYYDHAGRQLTRLQPFDPTSSYLRAFAAADGVGYFVDATTFGNTVWRTDGTPEGTVALRELDGRIDYGENVRGIVHRGAYYFTGVTAENGQQLWVSDGTAEGTRMLPNAGPDGATYYLQGFATLGEYLVYATDHGIYRTDGTAAGTVRLFAGSSTGMAVHRGMLYFAAETEAYGSELYRSDGTPAGTRLLEDYNPGPDGSQPTQLTATATGLYFSAFHPVVSRELHHLVDCVTGESLTFQTPAECTPALAVPFPGAWGERYAFQVSGTAAVDVRLYADFVEFSGSPGTEFLAELTLVPPNGCDEVIVRLAGTLPGTAAACLTANRPDPRNSLDVAVYPNPTAGSVTLEVPSAPDGGSWQLYDLQGRPVARGAFASFRTEVGLDGYPAGVYFLRVLTAGGEAVRRVVRQ